MSAGCANLPCMSKHRHARRIERYGSPLDRYDAETRSPLAGLRMATATPKSRCCQKRVRCNNCPVVVNKLQRAIHSGDIDLDSLTGIAQRARMR